MTATLTDAEARADGTHLPGDRNMWVFVLGDFVIFSTYFIVFMIYRAKEPDLFLASQRHLNLTTGTINTLLLLATSRLVALAVQAIRASDHRRATRLIWWSVAGGGLFASIKVLEWSIEISRGFTLPRNDFFMFYFALTGVHFVHLLLGLFILLIVLYELHRPDGRRVWIVEAGATYWHMVDALWVVIFALVYVMR